MRILCLAALLGGLPQLLKKFDAQVRGLRAHCPETSAYVLGTSDATPYKGYAFQHISTVFSPQLIMAAADALVQEVKPQIVYFRYPCATQALHRFVHRHPNLVVFEHNTLEENELTGLQLVDEKRWGSAVLAEAAGLCCVTNEIMAYERSRTTANKPALMLGNGIDPTAVQKVTFAVPTGEIHLLCAATFAPWHGVDRLLHGMAAYKGPERFVLHLAGAGTELSGYAELARNLGIPAQVIFHGPLDANALNILAGQCLLGVGALALHRKNMRESTALKHREYCLQGLPFFYSGQDVDFDPLPEFVLSLPLDDSPIDMHPLVSLARLPDKRPNLRDEMRRYGEEHLSWEAKTSRLYTFLHKCAQARMAVATCGNTANNAHLECGHSLHAASADYADCSVLLSAETDANDAPACPNALAITLRHLHDQTLPQDLALHTEIMLIGSDHMAAEARLIWQNLGNDVNRLRHIPTPEGTADFARHAAWNAGAAQARGRWLLPLAAGDMPAPDMYKALAMTMRSQPDCNMFTAVAETTDGAKWLFTGISDLRDTESAPPGCMMLRKSLWEDAGGWSDMHPLGLHDCLFWLACLNSGMRCRHRARTLLVRPSASPALARPLPAELEADALAMLLTMLPDLCPLQTSLAVHKRLLTPQPQSLHAVRSCRQRLPDQAWPNFCLGLALEGQGKPAEAMACQLAASKLQHHDWQPHFRLYGLHKALGMRARMEEDKNACLTRRPDLEEYFLQAEGG